MMDRDFSSSSPSRTKKDQYDQQSLSDNVSMINPFATISSSSSRSSSSGTMRHRAAHTHASGQGRALKSAVRQFDPYRHEDDDTNVGDSSHDFTPTPTTPAVINDIITSSSSLMTRESTMQHHRLIPDTEGYLEMEEQPVFALSSGAPLNNESYDEPIRTTSGLLLTHRHTPMPTNGFSANKRSSNDIFINVPAARVFPQGEALEMEHGAYYFRPSHPSYHTGANETLGESYGIAKARRFLAYVRLWNAVFCIFLLIGTGVVVHSMRHEANSGGAVEFEARKATTVQQITSEDSDQATTANPLSSHSESSSDITEQIILIPLPNASQKRRRMTVAQPEATLEQDSDKRRHGTLHALRQVFEEWVQQHNKIYDSDDDKERRFRIWHDNHHRTIQKNERHGPCKLTKQPVFGSNHFKDLTTEEFQAKYLTGYKGPHTDHLDKLKRIQHAKHEKHRRVRSSVEPQEIEPGIVFGPKERGDPRTSVKRHASVQERYLQAWKTNTLGATNDNIVNLASYQASSSCSFYNVSCWLRWLMYTFAYGIGGTMEPKYDSDSYPEAIDWRDYGIVTDVHAQGNCGACWAITATETIESAYAMSSGICMDLAESEVILCDDSCEMCNGGWPQNAYEFNMDVGGFLAESAWSYDGNTLASLTAIGNGEYDGYDQSYLESYRATECPNGSGSHSGDSSYTNSGQTRYAKIKGYGYATQRCICYTDGTGCDCDDQNEKEALMNVATYGPATVCLEASTWQDYAGGILTADSGCSAAFLDMNHCVQTVGYAFVSYQDGDEEQNNSRSGSGSGSGSKDDGNREGYWIIRNQWSENWGMSGYIWLAMGDNTCGVLNDMTIVAA